MLLDVRVGRDDESGLLSIELLADGQRVVPERLRGVDPDWVLPPLSGALLPSRRGRCAMLGTCCVPGCGSFSVQVRRDGDVVLWQPDPQPADATLTAVLDFPLRGYLDAVDAATFDPRLQERGRRLARAAGLALVRDAATRDDRREVTLPMAWQTGDGTVGLRHEDRLHVVALSELPPDDAQAVRALLRMALDPSALPAPRD